MTKPAQLPIDVTCNRRDLFTAVRTVNRAVRKNVNLPILHHVRLTAEGDFLLLEGTDLEVGIVCTIPAKVGTPGSATAPAQILSDLIGNLSGDSVSLASDKAHNVRVKCDKSDYKLLGLPTADYPKPSSDGWGTSFTIPQSILREMIHRTIFATSTDDSRATLTGVNFEAIDDTLTLAATDTHRLACSSFPVQYLLGTADIIVPARALNELSRLLGDRDGDVSINIGNRNIEFIPPDVQSVITSRLLEGRYPDYKRIIPDTAYHTALAIQTDDLHSAVKRAAIIVKSIAGRVILQLLPDHKLAIIAESSLEGSAREEINAAQSNASLRPADENETRVIMGPGAQIAFNAKLTLDMLNAIGAGSITLEIYQPLKPAVARPVGDGALDKTSFVILMPMQIKDN